MLYIVFFLLQFLALKVLACIFNPRKILLVRSIKVTTVMKKFDNSVFATMYWLTCQPPFHARCNQHVPLKSFS